MFPSGIVYFSKALFKIFWVHDISIHQYLIRCTCCPLWAVWAFVQGSWRTHESKCPWNIVKENCHLDDYFHQNILKFDLAKQHSPNNSINKLTWSVVVHNHVHSQQLMFLYGLWSTVILFSSLFPVTWLGTIFVFQTEDGVEFPKGSKAFVQGAECLGWCWVEISSPSIAL